MTIQKFRIVLLLLLLQFCVVAKVDSAEFLGLGGMLPGKVSNSTGSLAQRRGLKFTHL